ncbi:hypothetical protein AVEN_268191-1 [Araneus ventricosus]|uniref:Uncharacterized protein n=1 Tax=Araneus ventricosus TaxID=182803 RepID=A0A4Y2P0U2_ARAVE|nr:hypothetical protein AVEN_268191-1 [Araneus ventricosus]
MSFKEASHCFTALRIPALKKVFGCMRNHSSTLWDPCRADLAVVQMIINNTLNTASVQRQAVCNLLDRYSTIFFDKGLHCINVFVCDNHVCLTGLWHVRSTDTSTAKILRRSKHASKGQTQFHIHTSFACSFKNTFGTQKLSSSMLRLFGEIHDAPFICSVLFLFAKTIHGCKNKHLRFPRYTAPSTADV